MHLEVQRAPDTDQARDYCLKDRTALAGPWEFGEYSHVVAKRKLIVDFRNDILAGNTETSLWQDYPMQMARYPRMFNTLYTYGTVSAIPRIMRRRLSKPSVTVLLGSTGCGKTRYVYDAETAEDLYVVPMQHSQSFWLDGYAQHPAILIDEFIGNMPLRRLLKLLDRYVQRVQYKGGFVAWSPDRIYITSNFAIKDWYPEILYYADGTIKRDRSESIRALERRIDRVLSWNGVQFIENTVNLLNVIVI